MNPLAKFLVLLLALFLPSELFGDDPFKKTLSPDGRYDITGERSDLYLIDTTTGKKLFPIIPDSQRGQLSNINVETSWSPDSKTVIFLVDYGTKLSEFLLYRVDDNVVRQLKYDEPDPEKIFGGSVYPMQNCSGYDDNFIGPWLNPNSLVLLYGEAKNCNFSRTTHYLVRIQLKISKTKASVVSEETKVFDDQRLNDFLNSWEK